MNKTKIEGLKFYFENSAEIDLGIREQVLEVLDDALAVIAEQEAQPLRNVRVQISQECCRLIRKQGRLLLSMRPRRKHWKRLVRKESQALAMH